MPLMNNFELNIIKYGLKSSRQIKKNIFGVVHCDWNFKDYQTNFVLSLS